MIALIQRVSTAKVTIAGKLYSEIGAGMLILLGVAESDEIKDAEWLASKVAKLRIFSDEDGKMNLDVASVNGEIMVVSQFTLLADPSKGNRPGYSLAARPEKAIPLYESFVSMLSEINGKKVETGLFGADMQVMLCNDGPVTLALDSRIHMK